MDWKLGRRQPACHRCERTFLEEEPHFSMLMVEDVISRLDLCRACWSDEDATAAAVWWRTHRRSVERKGLRLDMESIEALFSALAEREEKRFAELRYLLCLILLRKKRLKVDKVLQNSEGEFLLVRKPRTTTSSPVLVFDFEEERQAQLRDQLKQLFDGVDLGDLSDEGESAENGDSSQDSEQTEGSADAPAEDQAADDDSTSKGSGSEGIAAAEPAEEPEGDADELDPDGESAQEPETVVKAAKSKRGVAKSSKRASSGKRSKKATASDKRGIKGKHKAKSV